MPSPRLSLRDLGNAHGGPYSLDLAAGECAMVMGPSGSGKSVLLRLVADLDPGTGDVWLDGRPRAHFSAPEWRRQVMYLAAEPAWWGATVAEHFPPSALPQLPSLAARLGLRNDLCAKLADCAVAQLSTGERQRLALLRGLVRQPSVLLLDEPTAALDEAAVAAVEALLREYQNQGLSLLWVTHAQSQAKRMGNRCLYLQHGRLTATGPATEAVP